jgi:hypothetical protein
MSLGLPSSFILHKAAPAFLCMQATIATLQLQQPVLATIVVEFQWLPYLEEDMDDIGSKVARGGGLCSTFNLLLQQWRSVLPVAVTGICRPLYQGRPVLIAAVVGVGSKELIPPMH